MSYGAHSGTSRPRHNDCQILEHSFKLFSSKYGGKPGNTSEKIPLATNSDLSKWFMDAGVIDHSLTRGDIDIAFAAVKMRGSKYITMDDMPQLLDQLASKYMVNKHVDSGTARQVLIDRLANSSFKLHGTTGTEGADRTGRLTEYAHYTGTQRDRGTQQHYENYRQEARKLPID